MTESGQVATARPVTSPDAGTAPGEVPRRRLRGWWGGRTLRTQIVVGILVLLVLTCLTIGVATTLGLRGFLTGQLDAQLATIGPRFAQGLEHPNQQPSGPGGSPGPGTIDLRGQTVGTFGARLVSGQLTEAAVIVAANNQVSLDSVSLPASAVADLAALNAGGQPASVDLGSLGAYRVQAFPGADNDLLISGLPLAQLNATVRQLQTVDLIVFAAAITLAGIAGAAWVRWSLRPLHRVASTALEVTRLPLEAGSVALPSGVAEADPRTEVGQVGAALNHLLRHVESALAQREASESRLRQFVADASHELRTPLASIRGYAELARREPGGVPERVGHALGRVESEAGRMGSLVEDLLLLARLDAGRPLGREPVDLCRVAIDALADTRVAGAAHRWLLELPEEPVTVTGDPHRLHQVVVNLLGNARVHTPDGTTVTLKVQPGTPDGKVRLSVTDDGPGIPAEALPTVFERFARADSARSHGSSSHSTGLGLAIVAAVVREHGGEVHVTSRPGQTCFEVLLQSLDF